MEGHLTKYIGVQNANELLSLPVMAKTQLRHEVYLTAVLHSIVQAAKKEGVLFGIDGGMGMSSLYNRRVRNRRRFVGNVDLEFPADIPIEKINRVFREAGLNAPKPIEGGNLPDFMVSRNAYEGGGSNKFVDVLITRFCPTSRQFRKHTEPHTYTNHIIDNFRLPEIKLRQFNKDHLIASKGLALADPNRTVTRGKMDDLHDLINLVDLTNNRKIRNAYRSGFWKPWDGNEDHEFKANLATVLKILSDQHGRYNEWLQNNAFNPYSGVTRSEWMAGLKKVGTLFGAIGYNPITAIMTKIQLANKKNLTALERAFRGKSPKGVIRSAVLARDIKPILLKTFNASEIQEISHYEPDIMTALLTRTFEKR